MTGTAAIHAAGGIVHREADDGPELLVIHRPRYDDWSLPKGHVDPGETALEAAVREVEEETGYRCATGDLAGIASYTTMSGEDKVVHYWLMTILDGEFTPNEEVDRIEWLSRDEAISRLSYALDRDLVRTTLGSE